MNTIDPLGPRPVRQLVERSLARLLHLIQQPEGRFTYAHEAAQPWVVFEGYNLLRHCGTLWFMFRAINELGLCLSHRQTAALSQALAYAGGKMDRPSWLTVKGPCFALVTKGAVKIGGVGLALVMLHEAKALARRDPRFSIIGLPAPVDETIVGLETYALRQIRNGDFIHKRNFSTGRVFDFESEYYTGEVLFGLMRSDHDHHRANSVCERLMERGYGIDVQSHWMAYAVCEAVQRGRVPREAALGYLRRLMEGILCDTSYRERRRSTPIACRSEAMTRWLLLLDGMGLADPDLTLAVREATAENLRLQLGWYNEGEFWKGDKSRKVQIDYIQHNGTAFLNWDRWQSGGGVVAAAEPAGLSV